MEDFRLLLKNVDRYYDGFEHAVMSYIRIPGNECKKVLIEDYIQTHPNANSSDVLEFMLNKTGFWDVYSSNHAHIEIAKAL